MGLAQSHFFFFGLRTAFSHRNEQDERSVSGFDTMTQRVFVRGICRAEVSLGPCDFHYTANANRNAESSHKNGINTSKIGLYV